MEALLHKIAAAHPSANLLHLAGRKRTVTPAPAGLRLIVVEVYDAPALPLSGVALDALSTNEVSWALLYSSRAGTLLSTEVDGSGIPRRPIGIAAISERAAAAAGPGWRRIVHAANPEEDALFGAAGL